MDTPGSSDHIADPVRRSSAGCMKHIIEGPGRVKDPDLLPDPVYPEVNRLKVEADPLPAEGEKINRSVYE